jgi:hypothetical protein
MIAGPAYPEFAKTVGPLAENITTMSWWHPKVRYTGKDVFGSTEAFNAAWAKKYGGEADYIDASSAVDGCVIQLAIEASNSIDPAKVRDAIAALDVDTLLRQGEVQSARADQFAAAAGVAAAGRAAGRALASRHQTGGFALNHPLISIVSLSVIAREGGRSSKQDRP